MSVTGDFCAAWKMKLMVANSATWQTLCSPDDPVDHLAIYYGDDDSQAPMPFPRGIINDTSEGGSMAMNRAGLSVWNREGSVHVIFEIEIPAGVATTLEEEGNWFMTQTGNISRDIRAMVNPPGQMIGGEYPMEISTVASIEGPARLTYEEREQHIPQVGVSQLPLWLQTLEFTLVP